MFCVCIYYLLLLFFFLNNNIPLIKLAESKSIYYCASLRLLLIWLQFLFGSLPLPRPLLLLLDLLLCVTNFSWQEDLVTGHSAMEWINTIRNLQLCSVLKLSREQLVLTKQACPPFASSQPAANLHSDTRMHKCA